MSILLTCPKCEQPFEFEVQPNAAARCPSCGLSDSPENFLQAGKAQQADRDVGLAGSLAPRRLKTTSTESEAANETDSNRNAIQVGDSIQREVDSKAVSQLSAPTKFGGKKRSPLQTILVLTLSVISVAGLFGLIIYLGNQPESAENKSNDQPENSDKSIEETDKSIEEAAEELANSLPGRGGMQRIEPPPEPLDRGPDYYNQSQWESVWQLVNPYVVKLEIESPFGNRTATGLIVDSRGWVVTSCSAIQEAGKINVSLAAKKLGDESICRDLTDQARGIVALDPANDLALIAVNRAQVLGLAELKLDESNNMVAAERGLIARVPPDLHRNWLTECRVAARRKIAELPATVSQNPLGESIDLNPQLKLIEFPEETPGMTRKDLLGSPIFDADGKVLGINSSLTLPGSILAVPAIHIRQLIAKSSGDIQPFPKRQDLQEMTTAQVDQNETQRDLRQQIIEINEAIMEPLEICRGTSWNPDNEQEYKSFQVLAENMIKLNSLAIAYGEDPEVGELVTNAIDRILTRISNSLASDYEPEDFVSAGGGEQFAKQVTRENPWFIFFADISRGAATSPPLGAQETIMLKIVETDELVLSPFYPELSVLRPGMRCMFVGRLDPRGKVRTSAIEGTDSIRIVNILFTFQVSKP